MKILDSVSRAFSLIKQAFPNFQKSSSRWAVATRLATGANKRQFRGYKLVLGQ